MRFEIDHPDDPRIEIFLGLREQDRQQKRERPGGDRHSTFIAEGDIVIERGLAAGQELKSVLVDATRSKPLPTLPDSTNVFAATAPVIQRIAGANKLRDPLACFVRPPLPEAGDLLSAARTVAVLEGVNNPNNLGVIMRNAAGLGIDAVLLDPTCGDPLYRRAIRASMGQVFALPHARLDAFPDGLDLVHQEGFVTMALSPTGSAELHTTSPAAKTAILLGSEGPGLSERVLERSTEVVRISMANDVDSLNVANAAAIAFHHFVNR